MAAFPTFVRAVRRVLSGRLGWFVLGIAVVVLVAGLRAIVFPGTSAEPGELVILTGADESPGKVRQQLVDQWNRSHPDNPARFEPLAHDADSQHSEMIARAQSGDSGVDVYNLDVTWIPEFAAAHYIRPLDTSAATVGFLAAPLQTCYYDGRLWALPFNTDAGLLYYRTDVVRDAAALPRHLPPSTADTRTLLAGGPPVQAGYAGQLAQYEGLTVNALEAIWAAGGDVVQDGQVVVDSPAARAGLRELADGLTSAAGQPPAILPASTGFDETTSTAAFRSGAVALMRNWPVAYDQLRQAGDRGGAGFDIADKFAVARLPGHSVLGGQNLAVAAGSKRPRAAQALIAFLTGESSEEKLFGDGGFAATRATAYADVAVQTRRPYAQTLLAAVDNARSRPATTHYALFSSVFQDVVLKTLAAGGRLPDDAVARLTDALNGRLR